MTIVPKDYNEGGDCADPALCASIAWIAAHAITMKCCIEQQDLEVALGAGKSQREGLAAAYIEAQVAEASALGREQELLQEVATSEANSLAGVAAKLAVVIAETEDNTDLADFPVTHVKSALEDLRRLMMGTPLVAGEGAVYHAPASVAARLAFDAWCQGDEKRFSIWMRALRSI